MRVGIIGCGNIARIQMKYISNHVKHDSIAICDTNTFRMESVANAYHIPNTYNDFQQMLMNFKPEIVHILTPPQSHKEIARFCLKQKAHVFIEKPLCVTPSEALKIQKTALENKRLICIDHLRVFDPLILKAQKLIKSGEFGNITNITLNETDNYLDRKKDGLSPGWLRSLPGEIFFDLLPHHLSLIDTFLKKPSFQDLVFNINNKEELVDILCLFSSQNGSATIHLSLTALPLRNDMTLECSNGLIVVDFRNQMVTVKKKDKLPTMVERILGPIHMGRQLIGNPISNMLKFISGNLDPYEGMRNTIREFYTAIQNGADSPIPVEKGIFVARNSNAIFDRILGGDSGKLNISERPSAPPQQKAQSDSNILVTGGTGFIGRRLVSKLVDSGEKVRILTHRKFDSSEFKQLFGGTVEIIEGDIANLDSVIAACNEIKTVFHLAAANGGSWLNHLDVSVKGTQNILEASTKTGVKRLVYVSSISVLNQSKYPKAERINEDFPYETHPGKRGNYTYSKLMAEKIVRQYAKMNQGISTIILRPGLVYGPGKNLISDVVRQVGNFGIVFGSGKRLIPLIYIDNLVDCLILAAASREEGIFNAIDSNEVTEKVLINKYRAILGKKLLIFYIPTALLLPLASIADVMLSKLLGNSPNLAYKIKSSSASARFDTSKVTNQLGWKGSTGFHDGFTETFSSH